MKTNPISLALEALCSDPYWSRLWIIQEFALGAKAEIIFGSHVVNAAKVKWLLNEIGTGSGCDRENRVNNLYGIRRDWQSNLPVHLIDLLHRTTGSRCSVRHDRVFGLVGLATDALRYLPEPNYKTDLMTLTVAMTRAYIEKTSADIILLAPHRVLPLALPSWSVDLFNLDQYPFERRSFGLVMRRQIYKSRPVGAVLPRFVSEKEKQQPSYWHATRGVPSYVTYQGNIMQTFAGRIGAIRSLGKAWSDPIDCDFPTFDPTWRRVTKASHLREEFAKLMLNGDSKWALEGYCYIKVFLASHGSYDLEQNDGELQRWICGNRRSLTGVQTLEECAESLPYPLFLYGPAAYWTWREFELDMRLGLFQHMAWRAEDDMRMMYLDAGPKWRAGWAVKGALLYDEVFLIPGCSSPVVLRKTDDGRYRVVGDAIVYGAMRGEYWEQLNADDIRHIEIV